LNFVRNSPSPRPGCTLGPREQSNVLTHYMDGSMVYGSDDDVGAALRLKEKGNIRISVVLSIQTMILNRSATIFYCKQS